MGWLEESDGFKMPKKSAMAIANAVQFAKAGAVLLWLLVISLSPDRAGTLTVASQTESDLFSLQKQRIENGVGVWGWLRGAGFWGAGIKNGWNGNRSVFTFK